MFIERYSLERNPFAEDSVRPLFVSQSMREAAQRIREVVDGDVDRLVISGAAGVGKTTLVTQQLTRIADVSYSRVDSNIDSVLSLLQELQCDLGPGLVEGTAKELRNVLEVYLQHQRLNERLSLIVVDDAERQSTDVMHEIESLCMVRSKGLPVVQTVLLTRNEDLATDWIEQYRTARLIRGAHVRLGGFTVEETASYVRACLQSSGCEWADELIPEHLIFGIQAFTRGVIGDINLLCYELLQALVHQQSGPAGRFSVTESTLKAAAARLHLRHEPERKYASGHRALTGTVQVNEPKKLTIGSARLIVTRHGKQLAEVALTRPRMVLGRDRGCDISFDSNYLSRYQNLFMETVDGWMLIDLNSTNGCFVNGRRVNAHRLEDGDLIAVGHHELRFAAPRGRRRRDRSTVDPDTVVSERPN